MSSLFLKKDLARVVREATDPALAEGHGLKRSLSALNLTTLGIGAIIGAGIFSLTGRAAADYAGPGVALSFVIGGILCTLAGLCYAELAAMIPVAGSAYAYTYATMGELVAWIIGWDLALEYAFGAITVTGAWSGYVYSLLHKTFDIQFADTLLRFTKGPGEVVTLADGLSVRGYCNVPAMFLALCCTVVLYRGVKESAWVNNIIVIIKIIIVLSFIVLGWSVISPANLHANPNATGLAALVPEVVINAKGEHHFGWGTGGVLTGAGVVFFSYIGFDAVSTAAQEAKNPQRDMPIGILASLVICTILYILVSTVLTGVVNYTELGVPDPIAVGIDAIVRLRGWSPSAQLWFTAAVKVGAIAGLSSVVLVLMLGQARIFYAMAKDGLLPWFGATHPKNHTPHISTVLTGAMVAILGGFLPYHLVGELVSIGTLLAFVLVCVGVPILRVTNPDQPRPFRAPMPWITGPLGAVACLWVMSSLPGDTWLRLIVWLAIGFVIYFSYGKRNSLVQRERATLERGAQ